MVAIAVLVIFLLIWGIALYGQYKGNCSTDEELKS